MKNKATTKKKPPAVTRKITPGELHLAALERHIAQGGDPSHELTHFQLEDAYNALLNGPTDKKPLVTRENGQVTINAEMVDDLFAQTIGNLMALQVVWEKISLKEELS
jgi:hypothetical protein